MVKRDFWLKRIEQAWKRRSIIWLAGVRRSGKTSLCKMVEGITYFDCELPEVREMLTSPSSFLKKYSGKRLVLDEIHRLANPSELLKIAADHYPTTRIIATGSLTLEAKNKFKDTLTGRKIEIYLTPMLFDEGTLFGNSDLDHRMLFGGLPPFFLQQELPDYDFQEWFTSFLG